MRNLYKCKQVACSAVVAVVCFVYPLFFIRHFVVVCLRLIIILMLLPYFCLFVNHVNKPIIVVFGAFVLIVLRTPFPYLTDAYICFPLWI